MADQNSIFLLRCEGKIKVLRGYCGDEGPNLYIGPWALFGDVDMFEEGQTIRETPEWRITYGKGGRV